VKEQVTLKNTGTSQGNIHLLVEQGGGVVGRSVAITVGKTALLEDFCVHPSARNQGIGTQLLNETERLAVEYGATSMKRIGMFCDTDSIPDYIQTVNFLRKRGYSYRIVYLNKNLQNRNK
jgi:GNAT superfamily N-acetyltransferase